MNKELILNKIRDYYGLKNDSEFARYLGVAPQVVSNWKSRNTYDATLLYTKCLDISASWLLTGKGEMLENEKNPVAEKTENYKELAEARKKMIGFLEKDNARLEEDKKRLKEDNRLVEKELESEIRELKKELDQAYGNMATDVERKLKKEKQK